MNRRLFAAGGLGLAVVLLFALNVIGGRVLGRARVDLTQGHIYTLSSGTREILGGLTEPVTVRLFLSRKLATRLPGLSSYTTRALELLDEYRRIAGGKLDVRVIDPEPFSEDEDRAVGYGLQGIPLGDNENTFYFGVVASGPTGEEATIPFVSPDREQFMEYDLTRLIYQVAHPKQRVVGLLSSIDMSGARTPAEFPGAPRHPWVVLDQMSQLFEVRTLDRNVHEIPADMKVLMVVHPRGLDDRTLYAIDQFVLRGGRLLLFVDPLAEGGSLGPLAGSRSQFDRLLKAWGVDLAPRVAADLQLAQTVRFSSGGRPVEAAYPLWIAVPPEDIDNADVVTADLGSLLFATPGYLVARDDRSTTVTPLVHTTDSAMAVDPARMGDYADPQVLLREYKPGGKALTLAARITGPAHTAFPDGPPALHADDAADNDKGKDKDSAPGAGTATPVSEGPINVIVVADTDMLADRFWVRVQELLGARIAVPTSANGSLVINALDNLSGTDAMISVRNRGHFSRPFTRVNALRESAELRFRQKEQQLLDRLKKTEQALTDLESAKKGEGPILNEAQLAEIERFRNEKIAIRADLRRVRHELRKDIEGLETEVKVVNIALVPLLIALGGLLVGWQRRRRRRTARESSAGAG